MKSLLMKCHLPPIRSKDPRLRYTEHLKLASFRDSGIKSHTAARTAVRAKELFQDGLE